MPKINKSTIKILPRTGIRIYKFENKNTYFCRFYVGTCHYNSGKLEKSLNTKNIKEAISKATQIHRDWFVEHKDTKTRKGSDFDLDIALPFLKFRIRKYKNKTHLKNNEQGERDKSKWNHMKPFFEDVDYNNTELVEDIINDQLLTTLKENGKSGGTINKYMSVLNQMFTRGQRRGVLKVIPDLPTERVINTPRPPYDNKELNLICQKLYDEYVKSEDKFFLEMKDYVSLSRSAGFRQGLEMLNIKKRDYKYIYDYKNRNMKLLQFTVYDTKTKPMHPLTCNPYFTKKYFPEIERRNPDLKDDDYFLFPDFKDRHLLTRKTGKLFTKTSKGLNLYYKNGGTRPIYSIRHTFATQCYKQGMSLEDIATSMNTSVKMLMSTYLGLEEQTLIERSKRMYPKFPYRKTRLKVVK